MLFESLLALPQSPKRDEADLAVSTTAAPGLGLGPVLGGILAEKPNWRWDILGCS